MLGLGLALSIAKKTLGDAIDGLLSTLSGRATYYENGSASKSTIKAIDNADVLDKATILLTPTATSDARVHSVKTYTGDDYLGATWIGGSGWSTITDGISCDGSVSGGNVNNNVEMTDYYGHKFLLTYTLSNVTDSSTLKYKFGGGALVSIEGTDGTHSIVVTNDATVDNFQFVSFTGWAGDITNISIIDVSSDFDFDRASSATRINSDGLVQDMQSITDPELVTNGDFELNSDWLNFNSPTTSEQSTEQSHTGTYSWKIIADATQQGIFSPNNFNLTSGHTYSVSLWIYSVSGNSIKSGLTNSNVSVFTERTVTVGQWTNITYIATASSTGASYVSILSQNSLNFFVDNVSVKDITFSDDVDLARINYDSNGDNGHILLEPTSTNLVTYSEDFSGWTYVSPTSSITVNNAVSPDGTSNADTISYVGGAGNDYAYYNGVFTTTSASTFSVYARTTVGTKNIALRTWNTGIYETKTITTEWQRFTLSISSNLSSEKIGLDNRTTYGGSGTSGDIEVWGAQLEELSYATSYIPTLTGSTVTRATETLNGSGNSTLINSTEGVLYAEIAALAEDGIKKYISLSDGSTNNDVRLYFDTNGYISALSKVGGSTQVFIQSNAYTQTNFNKIAFKYKVNDFALWINGTEVATDNSGSVNSANTLNQLNFNGNNLDFFGKCKALSVFNEALSDTELQNLTS